MVSSALEVILSSSADSEVVTATLTGDRKRQVHGNARGQGKLHEVSEEDKELLVTLVCVTDININSNCNIQPGICFLMTYWT